MVLTLPMAVVVVLKGKVWTGLLGMFIVVLLVIGAIRLSRPHAPWARWRYTTQPDKMRRAMQRERTWRRPVVQAKLWLQCAIAGTPRLPDERTSTPSSTTRSTRRRRPRATEARCLVAPDRP